MNWIGYSLLAALFTSLRHIHIRKYCGNISAPILVFLTRLIGSIVLLPTLLASPLIIHNSLRFTAITLITVIITMAGTVASVRILQRGVLSRTVPYLSFEPIFMIPWALIILKEAPTLYATIGISLTCAGAFILNTAKHGTITQPFKTFFNDRNSMVMLSVAFALSCTTVCDKIAIQASSATTYSIIWTITSALLMSLQLLRPGARSSAAHALKNPHTWIQATFWAGAFICQMIGVQAAAGIPSGVTYVKTVTMINVILTVVAGGVLFREHNRLKSILSSALMTGGAILVICWH